MLATIAGPISSSLGSFSYMSWIAAMFPIGCSISQPLSGHLTDIFGRRKGLIVCYGLFATGTLACGLSGHTLWIFLTGRAVQGIGGGALASITSFIETDLVPMRKRPLIEGIGNVAFGATLAFGGIYGGSINDAIGWRWAFLIQAPVIVLNGIWVILMVKIPRDKESSTRCSVDYIGCTLLVLIITFFQYGMNAGSSESWKTPLVIASLAIAGLGLVIFLFWDSVKAKNPVIPLRLLLERTIASSQLSFFFTSAAAINIMFYVPIYLQLLGYSARDSGLRFIPYAVTFGFGSFAAGALVQISGRYYWVNIVVQAASVTGVVLLCTLTQYTPAWAPFIYLSLLGLGFGGAYVTRLMGILTSVDEEKQAVIQASSWTVSSTGYTVGIAAGSAIFQKLSLNHLQVILSGQPELLANIRNSFEALSDLSGLEKEVVIAVYLKAVKGVFFLAVGEVAFAAVVSLFMKNNKLSGDSDEKVSEEVS